MIRAVDSDTLELQLSDVHSLDVIRHPKGRKYRVIFAEKSGVQRRAFVDISFEQALKLAKFLANIDNGMKLIDDPTPTDRMPKLSPEDLEDVRSRRVTLPIRGRDLDSEFDPGDTLSDITRVMSPEEI